MSTSRQGACPRPTARDEVLLHPKFAAETSTEVNDTLTLRIGGERHAVRVVGIASDPEYLYPLRSTGDLPSPGEFAVLFAPEHVTESLLGHAGSGNDVAVRADPGADISRLGERLEDELEPYGVVMTAPRDDQPGYEALRSELDQNRVMALWMPLLVLAISSMSLFIALSRLVTAQRGEIGLAKALGYTDGQTHDPLPELRSHHRRRRFDPRRWAWPLGRAGYGGDLHELPGPALPGERPLPRCARHCPGSRRRVVHRGRDLPRAEVRAARAGDGDALRPQPVARRGTCPPRRARSWPADAALVHAPAAAAQHLPSTPAQSLHRSGNRIRDGALGGHDLDVRLDRLPA